LKLPLRIEVVSFSHKLAGENGCYPFIPPDENTFQYVFDMRLLPNPHTDPDLKDKTGLDGDVQAFVRPSIDPNQWFVMANDINELLGRTARVETDQPAVTIRFCLGCVGGNRRSPSLNTSSTISFVHTAQRWNQSRFDIWPWRPRELLNRPTDNPEASSKPHNPHKSNTPPFELSSMGGYSYCLTTSSRYPSSR